MITIVHGDDTAASRNFLNQKKHNAQFSSFDGGSVTLTDLAQELDGRGLFQETKALFIEHLFTKKKGSELQSILSYLQAQKEVDIFLWEAKELSRSVLSSVKDANRQLFKYPSTLFQFLDTLKPEMSQQALSFFHTTLSGTTAEMIFAMLSRQIRLLLALRTGSHIEETERLAPWQRTKLKKQAESFSEEKLITLHNRLFAIDKAHKTGGATVPLTQSIDIFLLEL